jgi:predicted MFS family arabinose efflux permease
MSEFFGRCYIYLISFFLFTICNIPIATAQNGGVFLLFRLLTGLCGSGFLSIAGGRWVELLDEMISS